MDGITIDNCLKNCKVTKPYYGGIFSIDNIPNYNINSPCFYVINTDISSGPGKHWLLLFFLTNGKNVEIFDSLGKSPYAYHKSFKKFLNSKIGWNITYNNKSLQGDSNVCGAHVLFYAYKKCNKKYGLATIINRYYINNVDLNDCNVLYFVKKKFKIKNYKLKQLEKSIPKCNLNKIKCNVRRNL